MEINGIKIEIKRKHIKNLHIYVRPPEGSVLVTAPYACPEHRMREFILGRRDWIIKSSRRVREASRKRELWKEQARAELAEKLDRPDKGLMDKELTDKELRAILKRRIDLLLPELEERTGLSCSGISIRAMKSRWGSCTPGVCTIRINLELVLYPDCCLEYILLHELAHTRVPNHGKDFYAILDRYMPDWRERRRMLR